MGTWGYGILDNDVALDIKEDFDEAIESGQDFDTATWTVLEQHEEDLGDRDDGPVGYLALAAVQIERGHIHEWLRKRALAIIDRRRGLSLWRAEGKDTLAMHVAARRDLRKAILAAEVRKARRPVRRAETRGGPEKASVPPTLETAASLERLAVQRGLTSEEAAKAIALLVDPDGNVRFTAGEALRIAADRRPLPKETYAPLLGCLVSSEARIRARAAEAILSLRFEVRGVADRAWLPPLIALLSDASADVRGEAAFAIMALAMGGVYSETAFPHLTPLLSGPTWKERAGAAAAIAEMGEHGVLHPEALPDLVRLLEDPSDLAARHAVEAIREYAVRGKCLPRAAAALTGPLQHAHREGTEGVLRAISALAREGFADPMAVGPLQKLSKSKALSGYLGMEDGREKHYTIGELAQRALTDVRAALEKDVNQS